MSDILEDFAKPLAHSYIALNSGRGCGGKMRKVGLTKIGVVSLGLGSSLFRRCRCAAAESKAVGQDELLSCLPCGLPIGWFSPHELLILESYLVEW